jgi:hypothetical protein
MGMSHPVNALQVDVGTASVGAEPNFTKLDQHALLELKSE